MHKANVLAIPAILCACGGSAPPPRDPEPVRASAPPPRKPALQLKSELGTVDPSAVKRSFHALEDRFVDCQKRGLERVEVLAGSVKFFLRIGHDGAARWAYLEESELGDRATERCLLDTVMGATWPKPEGGDDAEAHYGMELPLQATRPPTDWSSEKVEHVLGKHGEAIERCKAGASGTFRATMYVGPGGKVLSAGVVAAARDSDEKADCLAEVLEKLHGLPSPGSWPAKVSFGL
jgi:hypothetical protein